MSTRSCIAHREGDGWRGVYHHSDGYPSGLGCYIFRAIRHDFNGDVRAFLDYALSHDGGWSHIYPGGVVKAHPRGGETFDTTRPQPQCRCHGYFSRRDKVRPGQGEGIQTREYHGFDIEWVYVLDPEARTMAIFQHDLTTTCPDYTPRFQDVTSGPCLKLKAVANLNGPEPDWWEIEEDTFNVEHLERRETWVDQLLPPAA